MTRKQRKVVVRGTLREEPDTQLLAIAFLMLARSLDDQRKAGLVDRGEGGGEDA